MSTAFNTVVNVDVKEALERAKRMQATLEIMKTVEDFEFARNVRPKKSFIPTELPSNDQIVEIIRSGWEDVKKLFEEDLGNAIVILWCSNPSIFLFLLDFKYDMTPPEINLNPLKLFTIPIFEDLTDDDLDDDDLDDYDELDDNQDLLENDDEEIEDTPEDAQVVVKSIGDLIQLPGHGGRSATGFREVYDDTKKGFVKLARGDEVCLLRKSSVLWMLSTSTTKISTDRLHRFVENREDEPDEDHIKIGDFIKVKWTDVISICSVLQFKYKKSKYKFMKSYCPIKHQDGDEGGQGVLMLVDFYQVQDNFLEKSGNFHCFIDINSYISHIKTARDNATQKYMIISS